MRNINQNILNLTKRFATLFQSNCSKKVLLLNLFTKSSSIKYLKHCANNKSTLAELITPEEPNSAMQSFNESQNLKNQTQITDYQNQDGVKLKKQYNLFISNVPHYLEDSELHNYFSKYGEITSLVLKKNEENKNLGYGYVQFKTEEAQIEVLKEHEQNGMISFPNSNISFNVQKFEVTNNKKSNNITILNLFQHQIPADQKDEKTKQINQIFEQIKKDLSVLNFQFHTEYNENLQNFSVKVNFQYDDQEQEEHIYQVVRESVEKNFQYKEAQIKGPIINFMPNESSERILFLQGIKFGISEQDIADWILKTINVFVQHKNIKIINTNKPVQANNQLKTQNVSVFFDSQADGQKFMIFCAKQSNKGIVDEIFHNRRVVTIYIQQKQQKNDVTKLTKKFDEFQQNKTKKGSTFQTGISAPNPLNTQFCYPPFFINNPNQFINQQNQNKKF
ncbi:hypothetical protein ABPG74_021397 [Tetrahymena malaccensis]